MQRTPRLDLRRYRGEWVALDPTTHKVVANNASLREAERKAAARGVKKPVFLPVPETDAYFVGAG